jgi:hypothetical protein
MSDDEHKPKLKGEVDLTKLELSAEEGFVLSRIDGSTSVKELTHLTGMSEDRVGEIVDKLASEGAIDSGAPASAPSGGIRLGEADDADVTVPDGAPIDDGSDDYTYEYESSEDSEEMLFSDEAGTGEGDAEEGEEAEEDKPAPAKAKRREEEEEQEEPAAEEEEPAAEEDEGDDEEAEEGDEEADDEEGEDEQADDAGDEEEDEEDGGEEEEAADEEEQKLTEANYRKLFETELHPLERDIRVEMARTATGAKLCAFCFDPDPGVIKSILENTKVGFEHARLIANHHRNPVGIDALARRSQLIRDRQVQRFLLRNNQCPEAVLKKILANKPLMQLWQLNVSRENSDRAKRVVRQSFRKKWQATSADDRVGLLFKTEGRCLNALIGLGFEGRTVSMLCGRTFNSTILIQNILRFSSTPPLLIQHLFKQNSVRRSPMLKKLILQHPNCPSSIKRGR